MVSLVEYPDKETYILISTMDGIRSMGMCSGSENMKWFNRYGKCIYYNVDNLMFMPVVCVFVGKKAT